MIKRMLMAMVLCLVCTLGFGQSISVDVKLDESVCIKRASNKSNIDGIPEWDYIGSLISNVRYKNMLSSLNENLTTDVFGYNSMRSTIINNKYDLEEVYNSKAYINKHINFPNDIVLNNYKIGWNCTKAGKICIGFGIPITVLGGIIYGVGIKRINEYSYNMQYSKYKKEINAGAAFLAIGSTLISVSVPLFCWGNHIKRECNMIISK